MWPFKRSAPETEERALSWLPWWDHAGDRPVGGTNSGAKVDERTALTFSAVWAAATLIADSVASLPAEATVSGKPADLPAWIRSPHLEMRSFEIWNQLVLSMVLWGNGYAQFVLRPSDGAPVGLTPIDPRRVTVEWNPNVPGTRRYKIDNGSWLTRKDIFHLQGPTLPGEPKGMSVIAQARESIGLGLTLEEFGARYFSQGSMAKIVLEVPGQVNEERATGIVKVFEKFHRGKGNWHRPAIMSGGGKVHNISIPPDDAQFLQSREFQAMDVARWFRVPPHRIGIVSKQSSWGSGLAEENVAMVQHTFKPWILRLEQGLSAYAPGPEGLGMLIRLRDDGLLRGTTEEQDSHAIKLYEAGLITKDEARIILGKPTVGGKDGGFKEKMMPPALGGPPKAPAKQESQQGEPGPRDEDGKRNLAPAEVRASKVERSVNRSGDNCKACAANSDPAKVPVHPGCNCDIVTDSVELLSIEENQFKHGDSAVRPNLSTVAILDDKNSRFSDVYRWFDSVAPLMTEQDTVSMTRATEEIWLMVQSLVDVEIMAGDADVVTRDLDSGATMLLMRPGAGLDGLRQLYREATEGGANA